jgi:hypothetical protein
MLQRLVVAGWLLAPTNDEEWRVLEGESIPRAIHPCGAPRVWAAAPASQPEQHPVDGSIQALCKGYLGVGAHWHLFWYFFKFVCLKDDKIPATIGYANLWTK